MLTHVLILPQIHPTLPSWLEDFNGLVGIENCNPDEDYCNAEILSILLAGEAHAMSVLRNTIISTRRLAICSLPFYNEPPCEASMPFLLRPLRRFPVQCLVWYH
mgnify:CR=1 FL=1